MVVASEARVTHWKTRLALRTDRCGCAWRPPPPATCTSAHAFVAMIDAALARQRGGQFILRIEDTDQERFVPEAEEAIYDGLRWLGLRVGRGPGRRAGRTAPTGSPSACPLYQEVGAELVASGQAYRCWCSPERLDEMRREQQARKQPPKYDRLCLGKTEAERKALGGYTDRPVRAPADAERGRRPSSRTPSGARSRFENALIQDTGAAQVGRLPHLPPGGDHGRPRDGHHPRLPGRGVAPQRAHPPAALRRHGLAACRSTPTRPCCSTRTAPRSPSASTPGPRSPGSRSRATSPADGAELPGQPGRPGPGPGAPGRPQRAPRAVRLRGDRRATWTSSASAPRAS